MRCICLAGALPGAAPDFSRGGFVGTVLSHLGGVVLGRQGKTWSALMASVTSPPGLARTPQVFQMKLGGGPKLQLQLQEGFTNRAQPPRFYFWGFLLFSHLPPFTVRILSTKHPWKWGPLTWTPGVSPAPLYRCDNELPRANESKHQSCRDSGPCTEAGGCFQGFQAAKYPPAHLQLELERLMRPFIDGSRD